jgi:tRNA C32,U32 (ribose-2'-O)-methylase TrmJ
MKIQFILVESRVPENIGAGARSIKMMGFSCPLPVNQYIWVERQKEMQNTTYQ